MKKTTWMAYIAAVVLGLALILSGYLLSRNNKLNSKLAAETTINTNLVAQKNALQTDISRLSTEIASWKGKNTQLEAELNDAIERLARSQAELETMIGAKRDKKEIEKKLAEVLALKEELTYRLAELTDNLDQLTIENQKLNNTIIDLRDENSKMAADMQMMQAILADNFLIEALKRNADKPTVASRRTGKIRIAVDVPIAIQDQIHFKIKKSDGGIVDSRNDKSCTLISLGPSNELLATGNNLSGMPIKTKRFNMTYNAGKKMKPGIYIIEVYNNDTYLGASQIRLK